MNTDKIKSTAELIEDLKSVNKKMNDSVKETQKIHDKMIRQHDLFMGLEENKS